MKCGFLCDENDGFHTNLRSGQATHGKPTRSSGQSCVETHQFQPKTDHNWWHSWHKWWNPDPKWVISWYKWWKLYSHHETLSGALEALAVYFHIQNQHFSIGIEHFCKWKTIICYHLPQSKPTYRSHTVRPGHPWSSLLLWPSWRAPAGEIVVFRWSFFDDHSLMERWSFFDDHSLMEKGQNRVNFNRSSQ